MRLKLIRKMKNAFISREHFATERKCQGKIREVKNLRKLTKYNSRISQNSRPITEGSVACAEKGWGRRSEGNVWSSNC